jgi:EmrB/QacA subfamily drug resistance transporter
MGASIIQILDSTIANVAIPHMQTSLGATIDSVTWVLTSYILASAVAMPAAGWLSDRVGSRHLFLFAVAGFIVTSMLCGIATNLTQMVLFRILQGICAAFIGPLSQTILLDINPPEKAPRAMQIWGMGIMTAPIMGPMIGGWLTENYNWRWVFYINLPIGIPTLLLLWWLLPSRPVTDRKMDVFGFAMLALGLASLQLMLDRGQHEDWFESWEIIIELFVTISAFWMFIVHSMTTKKPLFDGYDVRYIDRIDDVWAVCSIAAYAPEHIRLYRDRHRRTVSPARYRHFDRNDGRRSPGHIHGYPMDNLYRFFADSFFHLDDDRMGYGNGRLAFHNRRLDPGIWHGSYFHAD